MHLGNIARIIMGAILISIFGELLLAGAGILEAVVKVPIVFVALALIVFKVVGPYLVFGYVIYLLAQRRK